MSDGPIHGGPAFPTDNEMQVGPSRWHYEGMSLRDYFAAKALPVFLANTESTYAQDAANSYKVADEMLKARNAR